MYNHNGENRQQGGDGICTEPAACRLETLLDRLAATLQQKKLLMRIAPYAFLVIIGIVIWWLTRHTPYLVDDFGFYRKSAAIHSLRDFYHYIVHFYLTWGGRVWGEIYSLLFFMMPKPVFNVLNALAYVALLVLSEVNVTGSAKLTLPRLVFLNFAFFAFLPAFGQNIFWLCGSANYLWSNLPTLALLALYRRVSTRSALPENSVRYVFIAVLCGLLGGWANENVSVGLIVILLGYLRLCRRRFGRIPGFAWAGLLAALAGALLLWLAPGNFVRMGAERSALTAGRFIDFLFRNIVFLFDFRTGLVPFILLGLGMLQGYRRQAPAAGIYVLGVFAAAAAMSPVGTLHNRSYFGCMVLLILAAAMVFDEWYERITPHRTAFFLGSMLFAGSILFVHEAKDGVIDYERAWQKDVTRIETEKAKGNMDILVDPIVPTSRFTGAYGLEPIRTRDDLPGLNFNKDVALYYGVSRVRACRAEIR